MMKLTWNKVQFMHGECSDKTCPICTKGTIEQATVWLSKHLTITKTGSPTSPWWMVKEENKECYQKLRGNLRHKGFYDK